MIIGIDIRHIARGPFTGVAAVTQNLLEHLFVLAPEDTFRIFYNGRSLPPSFVADWEARYSNVTVRFWRIPNRLFDRLLKLASWPHIDKVLLGTDVFLSPHALLTPLRSAPRVLIVHDLTFFAHPEFFSPQGRWWHRLMDVRSQAVRAASIVVPSRATAFDLQRLWGISEKKIHVIPWAAPQSGASLDLHSKFYIPASRYVLFLGTIENRKNILGLVQAFEFLKQDGSFKDLKLVLAGFSGWGSTEVKERIANSEYKDDMSLVGYISEAQKGVLLKHATLFAYPSFYEGFGLPVLEAMAAGVPVVTSNCTSLPEVTGNAAILVDPRRPAQIAMALREILSDEVLAAELSRRGREHAARSSWKATAQSVLALLRETANRKA